MSHLYLATVAILFAVNAAAEECVAGKTQSDEGTSYAGIILLAMACSPSIIRIAYSRKGWRIFHGRPTGFVANIPTA